MTDITKLAQREKFEAWWEREYKHLESSKYTDAVPHIKYGFWMAYQAGGAELVEAVEKAQGMETYWKTQCRGITDHCEELQARIAELESRTVTVNLASRRLPSDYVDGEFGNDDLAAIHNACLLECKVSVEKYLSAHGIVVKWEAE
ncbi:TPA: hypothetical protein MYN20_005417 [Klebsiella pneumoniae]|nr:hypothetical protein [Klebsiella pneumoniae]HBR6759545.1 hypothetical protein [Klebsiella pneumoniae]HCB0518483.1 hypothetical protein [Klebsiella pneumoniae]